MYIHKFFKLIWNYLSAASLPSFFAASLPCCRTTPLPLQKKLITNRNEGHGGYVVKR